MIEPRTYLSDVAILLFWITTARVKVFTLQVGPRVQMNVQNSGGNYLLVLSMLFPLLTYTPLMSLSAISKERVLLNQNQYQSQYL